MQNDAMPVAMGTCLKLERRRDSLQAEAALGKYWSPRPGRRTHTWVCASALPVAYGRTARRPVGALRAAVLRRLCCCWCGEGTRRGAPRAVI